MITTITKATVLAASFAMPLAANAQQGGVFQFGEQVFATAPQRQVAPKRRTAEKRLTAEKNRVEKSSRTASKSTQKTPQYDLRRPEVVSGARVTLFANFLQDNPGYVIFDIGGTSKQCKLVDWKNTSVTAELPRLGLSRPLDAQIRIILPNGRVAKTFKVLYVSQPDIVVHGESIPQPMPATPNANRPVYAQGGAAGFTR